MEKRKMKGKGTKEEGKKGEKREKDEKRKTKRKKGENRVEYMKTGVHRGVVPGVKREGENEKKKN